MSASASRSRHVARLVVALLLLGLQAPAAATPAAVEAALARLFPDAEVSRDTLFLTDEQAERAEQAAGQELPSKIVTRFVATTADGETTSPTSSVRSPRPC